MSTKRARRGVTMGIVAVACLSTYSVVGKLLLEYVSSHTLVVIGQAATVLLILLLFGLLPELKQLQKLHGKQRFYLLIVTVLSGVIAPLMIINGLALTTATNSILIGRLEPVFVIMLSQMLLKDNLHREQLTGALLMLCGIGWIVLASPSATLSSSMGDALIVFGALSWAVATVVFKKHLHQLHPDVVVLVRNAIGTLVLLMLFPVLAHDSLDVLSTAPRDILLLLLFYGVVTVAVAQLLWYRSVELITASTAALLTLLAPLFGLLLSYLILDEILAPAQLAGCVLLLIGLGITGRHQHHHKKHHPWWSKFWRWHA